MSAAMVMGRMRAHSEWYNRIVALVLIVILSFAFAGAEAGRPVKETGLTSTTDFLLRGRSVENVVRVVEERRRSLAEVEREGVSVPVSESDVAVPPPPAANVEYGDDFSSDVENCSPPAQRLTDRSVWGVSKRTVPSGPNPLHN